MDYHLKPLSKTCAETGDELMPGSLCYSALVEQDGRYVRVDYSEEGWPGPVENSIGFWKHRIPDVVSDKPKPPDADDLLTYFEQLTEDANPARDKLRYVLGLLLLQKRRLKMDGTRRDGDTEFLQLIGSHGEGPYEVQDFDLSDDELQTLQQSVSALLTGGVD